MIPEYDRIVLTTNLPEEGVLASDVGTVVHVHAGGEGYEVEFFSLAGDTRAVVTLDADQVRPVSSDEVPHARLAVR